MGADSPRGRSPRPWSRPEGTRKSGPTRTKLIFGLDGSLVEFYPRFEQRVRDALREILGDEVQQRVEIVLAKDGSGVGAALCAQAAQAMEEKGAATVTKE